MSKMNIDDEELNSLLKEIGLEKPGEQFSKRLSHSIAQKYGQHTVVEYKAQKWLGKFILMILVFFNLLFFYYLDPFSVLPEFFISISAFVLGVWGLIALFKKVSGIYFSVE